MEDIQIIPRETPGENTIIETMKLNQNGKNYKLEMLIDGEYMTFNLYEENNSINTIYFNQKMSLSEIKNKHQIFCVFNSCKDFSDYIKALFDNKKLSIKKSNDSISIAMNIEYLFKQEILEISLKEKNVNANDLNNNLIKEINNLKSITLNLEEKINKQNSEIIKLKEENNILKEEIGNIKIITGYNDYIESQTLSNYSVIINNNECKIIVEAIKNRLNKSIISFKKIYQASKDGGEPSIFHSKCDKVSNTLVLIKSRNNNRFGGFTSNYWESTNKEEFKDDKNAFVFSLDEKKIYSYKNDGKAIRCYSQYGPCFGYGPLIGIYGNPISNNKLYSFNYNTSFDVNSNFLTEGLNDYAIDYEVFQILFN